MCCLAPNALHLAWAVQGSDVSVPHGCLGNLLTVLVLTITTGFRRGTQSQHLTTGIICLAVVSHDSRLGCLRIRAGSGIEVHKPRHLACWTSYILWPRQTEPDEMHYSDLSLPQRPRTSSRPWATIHDATTAPPRHDSRRHDTTTVNDSHESRLSAATTTTATPRSKIHDHDCAKSLINFPAEGSKGASKMIGIRS